MPRSRMLFGRHSPSWLVDADRGGHPGSGSWFIEELVDTELDAALGRSRYRRSVSAEAAGASSRISGMTTELASCSVTIGPVTDQRATQSTEQHGRGVPRMASGAADVCGRDAGEALLRTLEHAPGKTCRPSVRDAVDGSCYERTRR